MKNFIASLLCVVAFGVVTVTLVGCSGDKKPTPAAEKKADEKKADEKKAEK